MNGKSDIQQSAEKVAYRYFCKRSKINQKCPLAAFAAGLGARSVEKIWGGWEKSARRF